MARTAVGDGIDSRVYEEGKKTLASSIRLFWEKQVHLSAHPPPWGGVGG